MGSSILEISHNIFFFTIFLSSRKTLHIQIYKLYHSISLLPKIVFRKSFRFTSCS